MLREVPGPPGSQRQVYHFSCLFSVHVCGHALLVFGYDLYSGEELISTIEASNRLVSVRAAEADLHSEQSLTPFR